MTTAKIDTDYYWLDDDGYYYLIHYKMFWEFILN